MMDVGYISFIEFSSGMNEYQILVRIALATVTLIFLFSCCFCCLWINIDEVINPDFDSAGMTQELADIELQSANYEERLRRERKRRRRELGIIDPDTITAHPNNTMGMRSHNWESVEETYIADCGTEYVVINTNNPDVHSATVHVKDTDLSSSSGDVKDVPTVSKDSDTKPDNEEDTVEKCHSSDKVSQQVEKSCDTPSEKNDQCSSQHGGDKSNVEDVKKNSDAAIETADVDAEDRKAKDNSES